MLNFIYEADLSHCTGKTYSSAESQINYILGDTGRSYVCGYKHFYILHFSSWMFVFCSTYWSAVILVGESILQSNRTTVDLLVQMLRESMSPMSFNVHYWSLIIQNRYLSKLPTYPCSATCDWNSGYNNPGPNHQVNTEQPKEHKHGLCWHDFI